MINDDDDDDDDGDDDDDDDDDDDPCTGYPQGTVLPAGLPRAGMPPDWHTSA